MYVLPVSRTDLKNVLRGLLYHARAGLSMVKYSACKFPGCFYQTLQTNRENSVSTNRNEKLNAENSLM